MTLLAKLHAKDPDLINLRKATRATIVSVGLFAVLKLGFGAGQVATFSFFASFVALVFADFGGRIGPRIAAYAALVIIGNLVIVIGSLLAGNIPAGAVAMFLVMFLATFATVFGGYAPAFISPIALAYSLTVLDALTPSAPLDGRILGWTIGGIAALLAAWLLWPVERRQVFRQALAGASKGLADALAAIGDRDAAEAAWRAANDAVTEARRHASTPLRPAGPLSHDIGLFHLVEHLEQAAIVTHQILDSGPPSQSEADLVAACADALRATGTALLAEDGLAAVTAAMAPLDAALHASQYGTDKAAIAAAESPGVGGRGSSDAFAIVRHALPAIALAHIAMWVEAAAAVALGARDTVAVAGPASEGEAFSDRPVELFRRTTRMALRAIDPQGVVFRNSLRSAAAMTLAVVLAMVLPVQHGFWITLGALLVLRSSASATSATALQAIAGTLIGFVVATAILLLVGNAPTVLWIVLPVTIFLAGYTPGVVGFLVGQASFTTALVVLFTLIDPVGILTAVDRVETVSLGALAAAVIGLILWPRGARAALAGALARVYRAAAAGMRTMITGSAESCRLAAAEMIAARRQADEAFGVALSERGRQLDVQLWLGLFQAPNILHSLVCGLVPPPEPWTREHCGAALAATSAHRDHVANLFEKVGDRLDPARTTSTATASAAPPSDEPAFDPAVVLRDCLDRARPLGPEAVDNVLTLIAWNQWLTIIEREIADTKTDIDNVVAVSRPRGWLRWSASSEKGPATAPTARFVPRK